MLHIPNSKKKDKEMYLLNSGWRSNSLDEDFDKKFVMNTQMIIQYNGVLNNSRSNL